MPIYQQTDGQLKTISRVDFASERELQRLMENNLEEVFGCRFVASEFSTGTTHGGRIDSLALSEDNNPVIIEYKKSENSNVINQALFYLDWIRDHHGDFEVAVRKSLGDVQIDWGHIRVICLAPSFDKYSLHAVKQMGAGLELWQYERYANGILEMEEVYRAAPVQAARNRPSMPERQVVTIETDEKPAYSVEKHLETVDKFTQQLFGDINEFITELDSSIAVVPLSTYIAYKMARNIACVELSKRQRLLIWISLPYRDSMPSIVRDMANIGHHGTGNLELMVTNDAEVSQACEFIREAYLFAGGN
jgi:predicted transport protein